MADVIQFWEMKMSTHRVGKNGMNCEMGGTILSKTVKEKDLGVTDRQTDRQETLLRSFSQ